MFSQRSGSSPASHRLTLLSGNMELCHLSLQSTCCEMKVAFVRCLSAFSFSGQFCVDVYLHIARNELQTFWFMLVYVLLFNISPAVFSLWSDT